MTDVSLIPFVCGVGASTLGAERGPLYYFDQGLDRTLQKAGIPATWAVNPYAHWSLPHGEAAHRNVAPRGDKSRYDIVHWHNQTLAENVREEIRKGRYAVTVGGDHSMAAGSLAGAKMALGPDATLGLIWVDAHPDLHTYESSGSKALHGMSMGTLTGLDNALSIEGVSYPVFNPENIIYAGLRDIDEGEILNAERLGIHLFSMTEFRSEGGAKLLHNKIAGLKERCDHILLSIDVDGFSDLLAPATGTVVPGGFMVDEILPELTALVASHSVPLIDLVEFNPTLPGAPQTYQLTLEILETLLLSRKSL